MQILNTGAARIRRKQLQNELQTIAAELQQHIDASDELTPEAEAKCHTLTARADAIASELKDLEAKHFTGTRVTAPNAIHRSKGHAVNSNETHYVKTFGLQGEKLDDGGFSSIGEFLSVLASNRYDDRIAGLRAAASSAALGSGGVMVPEQFVSTTLHPPGEKELILPNARTFAMNAGALNVSALDNLDNTDGEMYGGFVAQWVEEGGQFDDKTPKTAEIRLNRKKLGLFTTASNELVSDSDYESQLVPALQAALQDFRDYAFLRGDGLGKPKGILNDPAIVTVAKETGQAADTIVVSNLDKMYARLHPRLVRNAKWYINPTCVPQLLALVRATGTSGTSIPVLNESNGSFFLYGLPVELTSKLPVLGDAGDILLADVSQYAVGFGRGIAIDRSEHYKFQNDQTVWRVIWRGDGQGCWRSAYTPRNGDSLSWCVKLAERA